MKKAKTKVYKAVYVEWLDSCMRKKVWWQTADLFEDIEEVQDKFQTIAYLVAENKKEYIFANSIHREAGEVSSFACIFSIPKGAVTAMADITINKIKPK